VFGDLLKRVLNLVVIALAALTFFLVPVGARTPAAHLVAIFSTPPAREAGAAFVEAARHVAARAAGELDALRAPRRAPPAGDAR
jgi:hypothetical protein